MSVHQRKAAARPEAADAARVRRGRSPRPGSGAWLLPGVIVGAALVAFAAGAFAFASLAAGSGHAGHAAAAATDIELGGLTLQVEGCEWVRHDMLGGPTPSNAGPFRMPMTGIGNMPAEGSERLHVEVLIANRGDAPGPLSQDEFRLRTPDGKLWSPNREDQGDQDDQGRKAPTQRSLAPGQMTDVDLFFDVPERSGEPVLLWSRAGEQVSIPVGVGAAPQHQH